MNRSVHVHPVSLALGLILGVVCLLSMAQSPASGDTWPPPKKSVVNIFQVQSTPMPAGASFLVYQVPTDRWLTITGTAVAGDGGSDLHWSEDVGGTYGDKGYADIDATHSLKTTPAGGGSAVGWVFRPGSQVVIRNVGSNGHQMSSYAVLGYESRN